MPTGGGKSKASFSRQKRSRDALGAALDLDLPNKLTSTATSSANHDEDDMLVHNRGAKATGKKHRMSAVLPQDAHKTMQLDKDESAFAEQEEEELAEEANRAMREDLDDEDFAVPGFGNAIAAAEKNAAAPSNSSTEAVVVEQVAREFNNMTNSEQLLLLQKQSPELVKMFAEMKLRLADVQTTLPQTAKLRNLIQAQKRKKIQTSETNAILTFLETKLQLLLTYCIHINFFLLLKAEGKKVENHPVVDRLLEIRVYLEKLWPLEQKLGYTLSKLLSGGTKAMGSTKAQLGGLRSVADEDGGVYRPTKNAMLDSDAASRRQMLAEQEAAALEAEETNVMTRARVAKKKEKKKSAVDVGVTEAEPEDHFFSKVVRGGNDFEDEEEEEKEDAEAGMSLVDRLRARQQRTSNVVSGLQAKTAKKTEVQTFDAEGGMGDEEEFEDEADEAAYQRLLAEEGEDEAEFGDDGEYDQEDADMEYEGASKKELYSNQVGEDEKRGVSKKIMANRGATKSRRKDRKTPHTNRKNKVKKGERVAKTQSKAFKPLGTDGKFQGMPNIKAHLLKSRSMV